MGFDTIEINLVEVLKCIENEILKVDMYKAWSVKRWKLAVHEEQKGDVVNSIEKVIPINYFCILIWENSIG